MSQGWSDSEESAEGMPRAAVLGCPGQLHLREPEELLCSCCLLQLSPGRASSVGMSRRCPSDRSLGRGLAGAWLGSTCSRRREGSQGLWSWSPSP